MGKDILKEIVNRRRKDIERLGLTLGHDIPEKRMVGRCEFLGQKGTILEVKRASPSKGDIAPNLVPAELANTYAAAGTQAISVLTEENFFKGSLEDLIAVAKAVDNGDTTEDKLGTKKCAVLRKDFLLYEDEIDIAYRCGADAVLLIARILDDEHLIRMAKRAQSFEMQAFIEIREPDDLRKLNLAIESLDKESAGDKNKSAERTIVAGVNSRDLATFTIDPLIPAAIRNRLPAKAVFESGIHSAADAAFARSLGFTGILVGEAVAKNPPLACEIVKAFKATVDSRRGDFWKKFAERRDAKRSIFAANAEAIQQDQEQAYEPCAPMVKICGITREEDGFAAAEMGADMLGFVFSNTKRLTNENFVRNFTQMLRYEYEMEGKLCPLFIGVITETDSEEGKAAIRLASEGVLDAVQFHGILTPAFNNDTNNTLPCYNAIRIGNIEDFETYEAARKNGEPRILLDAKVEGIPGGSGKRIPEDLLYEKVEKAPLWIAGGITPENVSEICAKFSPELIDVSSGIEEKPGIKSIEKMQKLFEAIN